MFLLQYIKTFLFLLLFLSISVLITSINTHHSTYNYHFCLDSSNDTANDDIFKTNLTTHLGSLSSKAAGDSFYSEASNEIYSLFLCRGDVSSKTCQNCVNYATQEIQRLCLANKTAIIWYNECMLRYSDSNFIGIEQINPLQMLLNTLNDSNSSDDSSFHMLALIHGLISKAPYTDLMFATDEIVGVNGNQYRYGLVQCSRDISSDGCSNCFGGLTNDITVYCQGRRGWHILAPSCRIRYEEYPFYEKSPAPGESSELSWLLEM